MHRTGKVTRLLSEDEKQRLHAEEAYRLEIRKQIEALEPKRSFKARFWMGLNAPFVLWLLSSVIVGLFGLVFSNYQAQRADKLNKSNHIRMLDAEITSRIDEARSTISAFQVSLAEGFSRYQNSMFYFAVEQALNAAHGEHSQAVLYPEFKDRTFPSLLIELSSMLPAGDRQDVHEALAGYRIIQSKIGEDRGMNRQQNKLSPEEIWKMQEALDQVSKVLQGQITRARWSEYR
jgi:hypothetical protein